MAWEAGMELSAFFRKEGYNLCAIEIWPLCGFFSLPFLIEQGSTCTQSV